MEIDALAERPDDILPLARHFAGLGLTGRLHNNHDAHDVSPFD
jgi:DNA-binding NtrC family response regulator